GAVTASPRANPQDSPAGPRRWSGCHGPTLRFRTKGPQREPTLGLAVGLSRTATPLRRGRRGTPASSPARIGHAARVQGGPAGFRHYEEGDVPQLASLVCDSPPRGRLRPAHD